MKDKEITLVGGGLAGCLLAVFLARRGFPVRVFERLPDMRKHPIPAGRSINLSLSARGIHALKEVGLYGEVERHLVAMPGRMIHDREGNLLYQPYGRDESAVHYSVERAVLNKILLDGAEAAGAQLFFGEKCEGLDFRDRLLQLHREADGYRRTLPFETVIGTDGAGSAVRRAMIVQKGIDCRDEHLPHGYKELVIPPKPDGGFALEKNALHIWPRGGFMLIALPNPGGDFTCTLFLANEGSPSFGELVEPAAVGAFFRRWFGDVAELIPDLESTFLRNPLGVLGTVRCRRWHAGEVLLIGDAAHAIVPFHGQGMNLAFEDCALLDRMLDEAGSWREVFERFEAEQLPNANAIADMALENYVEMRDTVRDPKFALQKALSFELEKRLPRRFIPRYSMVMFHAEIPYAVAFERGAVQQALLDELTRDAHALADIDLDAATALARDRLPPLP